MIAVEKTPRTLLCLLEQNMLKGPERMRAIEKLAQDQLSKAERERLDRFLLQSGTTDERQYVGGMLVATEGAGFIEKMM